MKNKLYLIVTITFSLITFSCKSQQLQNNVQTEIVGTWISEDDIKVKLVFNSNGKCLDYYNNQLTDTFNYSISHNCGSETDTNSWFLKFDDIEDLDTYCYEIYGVNMNNDRILSIRNMKTGKTFIYNKQ